MYNGIDISKWQGVIDFQKVKASGIDFVMIRATYGNTIDHMWERNYQGAKAAGLNVGAYHYLYADNFDELESESRLFLSVCDGKQFEYPLVIDLEDKTQAELGKLFNTEMVNRFAINVELAGYYCMLYANKDWLTNRLNMNELRTDIWLAQWTYDENKPTWTNDSNGNARFGIWQNSNRGVFDGISTKTDTNISYENYPATMIERELNGYKNTPVAIPPQTDYAAKYNELLKDMKTLLQKYE